MPNFVIEDTRIFMGGRIKIILGNCKMVLQSILEFLKKSVHQCFSQSSLTVGNRFFYFSEQMVRIQLM